MSTWLQNRNSNLSTFNAIAINYSTLAGSTINASTIFDSTITTQSLAFSTLTGSTIATNIISVASTITVSTLTVSANVGIGITNPGYTLHVVGAIYASGDITALSDKRFKQDIIPLLDSLNRITQLTGYSYTHTDTDKKHIGLIAQEVNEVFPEAVSYKNDSYSLNYGCLITPVIQAMKELKERVDKQDEIIQQLHRLRPE
jgi:hypothetical protein